MKAIIVMYDSLVKNLLSAYGCTWTKTPNFKRFIPAVATEGCASECLVNLGQRPFAFQEARPPNGWCYYTRLAPDQYLFTKGSPNGYHLLHFFPFGSPGHRTSDSHVLSKQLKENDRYELTALKPGGDRPAS